MLLLLPLLWACKVVDAPADLEELVVFGFVHFGEEAAFPEAAVAGIMPIGRRRADALARGYRVSELDGDDLVAAGVSEGSDVAIVGLAAEVVLEASVDDVAWAWSYPDMEDVLSTTLDHEVEREDGSRSCFLRHRCETYAYDGWRRTALGALGTSEQTFRREFRWVADPQGDPVLTVRDLVPEPAVQSVDFLRVDQQYSYAVIYPSAAGTRRVEAFWIEARVVGVDLPDYFALDIAVSTMNTTADDVDAFIAENAP